MFETAVLLLKGFQPIFHSDIPFWIQVKIQEPMEHREETNKEGGFKSRANGA
jgi:hypothetical protein